MLSNRTSDSARKLVSNEAATAIRRRAMSGPARTPSALTNSTSSVTASRTGGGVGTATNSRRPGPSSGPRGLLKPDRSRPADASLRSLSVLEEDPAGLLGGAPADDLDVLVLEQLVRLEEVLDLDQAMGTDLVEVGDVLLMRIAEGDAQDFEVEALLVVHLEPADRPGPDVAARERRLVDQQQDVRRISVARQRVDREAVVEVVEDRRRQDSIEPEDPRLRVELVLVARATRDLDHDFDDIRELRAFHDIER